jgi:hypothetical protein
MALFWQYTQPSAQPEKNTVPEPSSPDMQGSSHMWSDALATNNSPVALQYPFLPAVLSTWHSLGQSIQSFKTDESIIILIKSYPSQHGNEGEKSHGLYRMPAQFISSVHPSIHVSSIVLS